MQRLGQYRLWIYRYKSMAKIDKIRVLIADDDNQLARNLATYISDHGFECQLAKSATEAKATIAYWKPRIILADLMLPGGGAFYLLEYLSSSKELREHLIHLLMMSGHNSQENVTKSLRKGAKDYIVKPFKMEHVLQRLIYHCRSSRSVADLKSNGFGKTEEATHLLHLTDLMLRLAISPEPMEEKLLKLTRMVTMKVEGVRCSVVNALNQDTGIVVSSNDDRKATGIRLDLAKYPEINDVVNRGQLVAIENISANKDLKQVQKLLKDIQFNSMIVCPVKRRGRNFGVLSLRMPKEKQKITDNEIRFVEIAAHVASLVLDQSPDKGAREFWMTAAENRPIPIRSGIKMQKKSS